MPKLDKKPKTDRPLPQNPVLRLRVLRKSGEPIVLTVSGGLKFQVEDDTSFQLLLELVDRLGLLEAVREGLKEFEEGKGIPWEEAKERLAKKYGIPSRNRSTRPA